MCTMYTYHGGIKEISLLYLHVYTNYSYRQIRVQRYQKNIRKRGEIYSLSPH